MAWNAGNAAVLSGPRAFAIGCNFIDRCLAPLPVTKDCYKVFALIHLDQLPLFRIFLLLFLTYLSAWYLDSICFAMSTFFVNVFKMERRSKLTTTLTSHLHISHVLWLRTGFSTRLSSLDLSGIAGDSGDSTRPMPGFNAHYYSFKIFPQFWLAKSTRIIHHNQLQMTKLGRI